MPARAERFFWVKVDSIDNSFATRIDEANRDFASNLGVMTVECVKAAGKSERLWLFRLATADQSVADSFNKKLEKHCKYYGNICGIPNLEGQQQTTLLQPVIRYSKPSWPVTDLGLNSNNNKYNGMLISYTYHEGKNYNIPLLELSVLQQVYEYILSNWKDIACNCREPGCSNCRGVGCYNCFKLDCPNCNGTGWKEFCTWAKRGYLVDYTSGVPIAIF